MSDFASRASRIPYPIQVVTLATLYVVTGWIGLQLASYHENVTLIWPPSGLSLAALILFGRRLWPGVLLGSIALNTLLGIPLFVGASICVGNTLEALVGAYLMVELCDFRSNLARLRDVIVLLLVGGAVTTIISAVIGSTAFWLAGDVETHEYPMILLVWWRGDFGGVVAFTPFLLLLRDGSPAWRILFRDREFWIVTGLVLLTCLVAFGGVATGDVSRVAAQLPFPFLIWAGVRLGTRGAVLFTYLVLNVSAIATMLGSGPFVTVDPHTGVALLWSYGVGLGSTALALAAAVSQRNAAEERHEVERHERQRIERAHLIAKERERIMREMHDSLGGHLVSVLSMVQRGNASADEVAEELRRTLDDMRIMIDSLESDQTGLREMLGRLRARLDPLLQRNGLRLGWRLDGDTKLDGFGSKRSLHILRVIQEAVTNAIQHARATKVEVVIAPGADCAGTVAIEIRDDGVGLPFGQVREGRGMENMKARASALDGVLRIEPAKPGSRVVLLVPIESGTPKGS